MFSWGPAPRRNVRLLAAAALVTLALAPVAGRIAVPAAVAQGPGGGYHAADDDRAHGAKGANGASNELEAVWSAARAPLRWLRQSSRNFQSLMRLLAERSARQAGRDAPLPPWPRRPRKDPAEVAEDPARRQGHGGEAGAGSHHGVRVKAWVGRPPKE